MTPITPERLIEGLVKPLVWEDADEGMCTKWRAAALGGHYELVAFEREPGYAVNFYWGRPLSFWFIQGEPDEWGPTGPKMFPDLTSAKAAARADCVQRICSALDPALATELKESREREVKMRRAPEVDNRPFCDCHEDYGQGLVEALEWYGEQARLCRLIHSEGDAGRHALAADGGKRARAALASVTPTNMTSMATDPELTALLAKSVETVKAMSPEERNAMIAKQAESYARSLQPCEHGMVDFEQCEQCRTPTNGEKE